MTNDWPGARGPFGRVCACAVTGAPARPIGLYAGKALGYGRNELLSIALLRLGCERVG